MNQMIGMHSWRLIVHAHLKQDDIQNESITFDLEYQMSKMIPNQLGRASLTKTFIQLFTFGDKPDDPQSP